jgi:predicted CoA-binding protein
MDIKEKEIAVIGVSNKEEKFGFKIFRDLLKAGFKVKGIHPKITEVLGQKIYHNLKSLETKPDLVITVVSPEITEKIVEDCKDLGIKEIWMQPGSESEIAIKKAKDYGIKVIYNACFMVEHKIW